jgi:hypothetical protein
MEEKIGDHLLMTLIAGEENNLFTMHCHDSGIMHEQDFETAH